MPLSESIELSTYSTQRAVKGPGDLVGLPAPVDSASFEHAGSHTMLWAVFGASGARLLAWRVPTLKAAIATEKDPSTEVHMITFVSNLLMREELSRKPRRPQAQRSHARGGSTRGRGEHECFPDNKAALSRESLWPRIPLKKEQLPILKLHHRPAARGPPRAARMDYQGMVNCAEGHARAHARAPRIALSSSCAHGFMAGSRRRQA